MIKKQSKMPLAVVLATLVHDDRILLIKREKGYYTGLWSLPGGKIENDEHISDAAVREVMEESGIGCRFVEHLGSVSEHLVENGKVDQHFVLHICKLHSISESAQINKNPETYEGRLEWFDLERLDEFKQQIIPSDYLMITKMLLGTDKGEKEESKNGKIMDGKGKEDGNSNNNKRYYNCVIEKKGDEHILRKFE